MSIMSESDSGTTRGLTGGRVLLLLLAFFGSICAVNAVMIHYAVSTFRGEVADHAYEVGLQFNDQIAAARAQDARNWRVDAHLTSTGLNRAVEVTARDSAGRPLTGLSFRAVFAAPVDGQRDKSLALTEQKDGVYAGDATVQAGHWDLEITGRRAGETLFQSRGRIVLE